MRSMRLVAVAVAGVVIGYGTPAYAEVDVRAAQWHLDGLQVDQAHRHSLGGGVTVAVLDSGVDAGHPDLRDNVVPGADLTGRGTDGQDDPVGSGTALAGLIAGHGAPAPPVSPPPAEPTADPTADPDDPEDPVDPEEPEPGPSHPAGGVLGLAPAATILPVVVTEPGASPAAATLAAGILAAVRHGAQVICIGQSLPDHPEVSQALAAALAAGVVVVVPGAPSAALARYGGAGLLGAVPLDRTGDPVGPPPGTQPGQVQVPAAGVMSTGGQGGYFRYGRTAEAAASAILAGAAALVLAAEPGRSGPDVAHRLTQTTDAGTLDLLAALTADVDPLPSPVPPPAVPIPDPAEPAPEEVPGADPVEPVAAFDSGDWRRWLVAVPLVVFLAALATASITSARAATRARRP